MKTSEDFTVEVRRDGLLLSAVGTYRNLSDATRSALDSAERLARGQAGVHLLVVISAGTETVLEIKVLTGRRLDE